MTTEIKKTAYELACEKTGRTPATIENFNHELERDRKKCFGEHKLRVCVDAANLNEDGTPFEVDWKSSKRKYISWMIIQEDKSRPAGVGFVFLSSYFVYVITDLGSRLYSKNDEISIALAKNPEIVEYFNEMMGV
jgi:hypothetical protein